MNITDPIFHDEAKAEEHIFLSRWPDGEPLCPYCESTGVTRMSAQTVRLTPARTAHAFGVSPSGLNPIRSS